MVPSLGIGVYQMGWSETQRRKPSGTKNINSHGGLPSEILEGIIEV